MGLASLRQRMRISPERGKLTQTTPAGRALTLPAFSFSSKIRRSCTVSNEFFTASLSFERRDHIWICTASQPPVTRFAGMNADQVHLELLKMGCKVHWSKPAKPGIPTSSKPENLPPEAHGTSKAIPPLVPRSDKGLETSLTQPENGDTSNPPSRNCIQASVS